MEIGEWKATAELNAVYRQARELGIETCLAELEAFGFTIVEPEKVAPREFTQRMLDAALSIAGRENPDAVALNTRAQKDRPAYGRQLFHLAAKDPIFAEAVMNPVALTLGRYLLGASCRLYSTVAFVKQGKAGCTNVHSDSVGMPPPLPFFGNVCNISWILTDYTKEKGTFFIVPGSHRWCRHPTSLDQPKFMGGPNDDEIGIPIVAKPGSLFVFHGNTWHGTYPKEDEEVRVHVVTALSRNYVDPGEDFSDLPETTVERFGPEFARLIGRTAWQGYGSEGPRYERMISVQRANHSAAA
jgi:ectoine hydroxylase-related dioxygenase (phytanoyl-CoA dioxygenase family)